MIRFPLCVALFWAVALPVRVWAAEPLALEVWVPGFEMRIDTFSFREVFRGTEFEKLFDVNSGPDSGGGVRIVEVDRDGPAAKAGLALNDFLVEVNGAAVRSAIDAVALLDRCDTGQTAELTVQRGAELAKFKVTVGVKRRVKEFRGVLPGNTTVQALQENSQWGRRVGESKLVSGVTLWQYKMDPWSKVVAVIQGDVVRAIDFVPPPSISADRIRQAIGLGEIVPLKTLPPSARVGGGDIEAGRILAAEKIYAFLLTDRPGNQASVKLVRLYSPRGDRATEPTRTASPSGRGWLGVRLLSDLVGVPVLDVRPGSAAEKAGLRPFRRDDSGRMQSGDQIVAVNNRKVTTAEEVAQAIAEFGPGDTVVLNIHRDGKNLFVSVVLQAQEE